MEGGTANWEWGAPWGRVTSTSHSSSTSWADSTLGSYDNNANTALTNFVSLVGASSPVLTFWHKLQTRSGEDFGHVEVSSDGGTTWTTLLKIDGTEDWNQERIDLNVYRGAIIGLRFRLQSDAANTSDGWYIDDVLVEDGAVAAAYPFTDDMESGMAPWLFDSPWGLTGTSANSGSTSWTDSPSGNYANNQDTSLRLSINLATALMPVLEFWQRYSLQTNNDFGYIEVSTDGGTAWTREYFVTGASTSWVKETLDLTAYAGSSEVLIRFRLVSNGSSVSDGWYVDDVSIAETSHPTLAYPLFEDFETGTPAVASNWHTGAWAVGFGGHSGAGMIHDSPEGNYVRDLFSRLILASTIDLSAATNPQLMFWHKYDFYLDTGLHDDEYDTGRVYASSFFGKSGTWQQVASFTGSQTTWTLAQIDLSAYAGFSDVRIMFVMDDDYGTYYSTYYYRQSDGWTIDEIRVREALVDVTLNALTDVTMHGASLSWTQNNETDFDRYEIYRAKNSNPTQASTLVATLTNPASTTFADTYAILQPNRYRYVAYVVDKLGRYSLGSNVVEAAYTVPQASFPFFDNMEGGTANWEWGAPWAQVTSSSYSASTSWADSPFGSYDNNVNTALSAVVSLADASSPVLTFWHKLHIVQDQDYGYVEVSTDSGVTWTSLLQLSGVEGWNQERIDLNIYRGAVIGLRFRLQSDGASVSDGWYIDDVRIEDSPVSASFPFSDNVELGLAPWKFNSPWGQTETSANSSSTSWTDSPSGNYGNNADASLRLSINLATALIPVLEWWQRYSLEENKDYGYIEVSTNAGVSWTREYMVTGGPSVWIKQRLDLTAYAGNSDVRIRFRLVSGSSGVSDGWYIDDVTVAETAHPQLNYPFFDDFEASSGPQASRWHTGSWGVVGSGYSGSGALTDSLLGNYVRDLYGRLILASTIDLSGANSPQLTFWHKHTFYVDAGLHDNEYDTGRVYVSNFYGKSGTWQQLASFTGSLGAWTQVTVDLSSYVGFTNVRVMFVMDDDYGRYYSTYYYRQSDGWYIDDVRIDEVDSAAPDPVSDLSVTGSTASSVSLRWTAPGDDGNTGTALSYDIRYVAGTALTEANWSTATQVTDEPKPSIAVSTEDFTVTGLTPNMTYYLGVKTSDEAANTSALSNVVSVATVPEGTVLVTIDAPSQVLASTANYTSTFSVAINVDSVASLNSASYSITFDPAVLQFSSVSAGMINGTVIPVGAANESPVGTVNVAQDLTGTTTASGTGYLATLTFTVIGATSTGSSITSSSEVLGDDTATLITSLWTGDSVTVVGVLSGDANGDRVVNALDVTKVKRIIVKLDPFAEGADAKYDGAVNALDLTKTKRIILGLD